MENQFGNENWVDEKVAAAFLGLSRKTIQDYRLRGCGPRFSRYNGRCVRYQMAELKEWAKAREVNSTSEPHPEGS